MASKLPAGWRKVSKDTSLYIHHDAPPMMMARPQRDGQWWVSVKLGGPEWHSYGHKTARGAMLHGSTLAALWNVMEARAGGAGDE